MLYQPRTTAEIFKSLLARVQARGKLKDVAGGVAHALLAFAEELNGGEIKIKRFRDLFFFIPAGTDAAADADIDDRTQELPGFKRRQEAVPASGDVLQVTRSAADVADELVLSAGSIVGRGDNPNVLYRTAKTYTLGVGVATLSDVRVVCLTPGEIGNTPAGTITRAVALSPRILTVTNTKPLTNGLPRETTTQVIVRVLKFLAGLARSQPQALEYCALSFTASDGTRAKFASLYEDLTRPGYSELIVDDGSGMQGLTRPGAQSSGVVPASGILRLWHEAPATKPVQIVLVTLANGGGEVALQSTPFGDADFLSVPERGIIELKPGKLSPGDLWKIQDYEVFTGLLSELQFEIEGRLSTPTDKPGWRAATTRVRVTPPTVQAVALALFIVPISGVGLADIKPDVINDAVAYVGTLVPGEPLFIAKLVAALMKNPQLLNVRVYEPGTKPLKAKEDTYPLNPKYVLRCDPAQVEIVPAPEA